MAVAYCIYWVMAPSLYLGMVGNDALFLADGARRIAAGHMPHADFLLPIGVLPFLTYLWAEYMFPWFSPYIGSHLVGFILIAPVLLAGAALMPNRYAGPGLVALVAIAALLPFNLNSSDYGIAFHASYNRLASALSLAYLAWLFRAEKEAVWLNASIIAYALVLAFFIKIVAVGVILAPLAVFIVTVPAWRKPGLLGLLLAALAVAAIELATGVVGPYLADIAAMSAVNAGGAAYYFASFIFKTLVQQVLVGLLVLWLLLEALEYGNRAVLPRGLLALGERVSVPLAMIAAIVAIVLAESQATGGLEFTAALGLLFVPGLTGRADNKVRSTVRAAAGGLMAGLLAIAAVENTGAVLLERHGPGIETGWAARFLPHGVVPAGLIDGAEATAALWTQEPETVRALEAQGHSYMNRSDRYLYLAQWITVDAALARLAPAERENLGAVATLGNVDFFGLALGAEPAKGLKIVHDIGRTILPMSREATSAYIAGAHSVFEPTCTIVQAPGNALFTPWFTDVLEAEFTPRVLTPCWTLHTRHA